MRPATIPDDEIMAGHTRIVMKAPRGHDPTGNIRDVEMLATRDDDGTPIFRSRIVLEEGDLDRLKAGEAFWVSFWGQVTPFDVAMTNK